MSMISSVGGASSHWYAQASSNASAMRDKMFAKVDSDGSGSVDGTELQAMLDHIGTATGISTGTSTGTSAGNATDLMTQMDSDGNGSLSQSELEAGMKDFMPPPASTMDFAQQRAGDSGGGEGPGGPPPGGGMPPPPPADDASGSSTDGTSSSSSTSSSVDPLDTNEDGVVSPQERLAGEVKDLMKALDTDGDGSVSKTEVSSFLNQLQAAGASTGTSPSSDTSSSGNGQGSGAERGRFELSVLRDFVRSAYAAAQNDAQGSTLSVAA